MVRKLKYHEQKLLKKVDFITWKTDEKDRGTPYLLRKYHIAKRDDVTKYTLLVKEIRSLYESILAVEMSNSFAHDMVAELKAKLWSMGLIKGKIRVNAESFCRRRLPAMMVNKGMMEKVSAATLYVLQGHVRVGPEIVKDPAYLVTRHMEDFITWVDTSAIKRHIMEYNEMRDDYEMM